MLLCGVVVIDVNDWEASAKYEGYNTKDDVVRWFWATVRAMSQEDRSTLLHFCTGSTRAPALGFGALSGYSGQLHPFTVTRVLGGETGRLPTASTCFNTLKLPAYSSAEQLRQKLAQAFCGAQGFDEGAAA